MTWNNVDAAQVDWARSLQGGFLLLEGGGFLLLETGSKIIIDTDINAIRAWAAVNAAPVVWT